MFSLDATYCDDNGAESASVRWQRGLDQAQDLARVCPSTRVVTVCDREADMWALFVKAASQDAALLVRARRSTRRSVVVDRGGKKDLWDHVAALPRVAGNTVDIAACGGKRAPGANRGARRDRNRTRPQVRSPCTGCC